MDGVRRRLEQEQPWRETTHRCSEEIWEKKMTSQEVEGGGIMSRDGGGAEEEVCVQAGGSRSHQGGQEKEERADWTAFTSSVQG